MPSFCTLCLIVLPVGYNSQVRQVRPAGLALRFTFPPHESAATVFINHSRQHLRGSYRKTGT
jgi:hypothetical protein